jgi:octopine/nopaline transport system permease protein
LNGIIQQFYTGATTTLSVFVISAILGTLVGFSVAVVNTAKNSPVGILGRWYVNVIRGVPELLIILIVFFGGTAAISSVLGHYVEIDAFAAGVAALTVVFGGYAAEVFRAAIEAVPQGQAEAAASLGLSRAQTWLLIRLPQMIPLALPAFGNLCISLVKDTSLVSIVGLSDVMRVAYTGAGSFRAPMPFYLAASSIYLALTSLLLIGFKVVGHRFAQTGSTQ